MSKGTIKLFDLGKEIGLIISADTGEELSFKRADVKSGIGGATVLNAGQEVEFDIEDGPGGRCALNILIPFRDVGHGAGVGGQGTKDFRS